MAGIVRGKYGDLSQLYPISVDSAGCGGSVDLGYRWIAENFPRTQYCGAHPAIDFRSFDELLSTAIRMADRRGLLLQDREIMHPTQRGGF
jgi:hypothetical protein